MACSLKQQLKASVHQPLPVHTLAHTGLVQQVHGHLLQDPGPNATQHIVCALSFDDHCINPGLVEQLAQQ